MSNLYQSLEEVLTDSKFPEVDCLLRKGRHIGQEDIDSYTFLSETHSLLDAFYRNYDCQLVRANEEIGDYFFLSSFGEMLGKRRLSVAEMKVGIALGYMVSDPEYIERKVPMENLVATLKMLLGEERFKTDFATRKRGQNTDRDEERAQGAVEKAVRQLKDLGFVEYSKRSSDTIYVLSPIFRFLEPVRGLEQIEDVLRQLITDGVVEDWGDEDEEEEE